MDKISVIVVFSNAVRRDHGRKDHFSGFGVAFEDVYLVLEYIGISLIDCKFLIGKFYFAKVDAMIRAIE